MVTFEIPGVPVAFARARVNKMGLRFTPKAQMLYANLVRCKACDVMAGAAPTADPVRVTIRAVYVVPPSWPKKRRESARWKTSKPDVDNIIKLTTDAMTSIVYRDDAQVVEVTARKVYGAREHLSVEVSSADQDRADA